MRACVRGYVGACMCVCVRAVSSPLQLILHKGRHGADLHGVGVVGRVLKQTIVGVEELLGQQEEELSGGAAVVQPKHSRESTPQQEVNTTAGSQHHNRKSPQRHNLMSL